MTAIPLQRAPGVVGQSAAPVNAPAARCLVSPAHMMEYAGNKGREAPGATSAQACRDMNG
jgi:hypothetical protein